MIGTTLSLAQQQRGLRYSYLLWLFWLGLAVPLWQIPSMGLTNAWGLAAIALSPLLLMLTVIWPAKNGNLLLLTGLLLLAYLAFAILAALRGGWATLMYGIEVLLITHTLFWLMWVVERLPKLQQSASSEP